MTTIKIDSNEDRQRIKAVSKIAEKLGYNVLVEKCEVGDYTVDEDGFCIEFKTASDYIASIMDGRLHAELTAMNQYENAYLILVNDFKNCYFNGGMRNFNTEYLVGSICSTVARYNVKVASFENKTQAYKGIFKLYEKSMKGEAVLDPIKITQNKINIDNPTKYMLMCLPSIGEKTAEKIMEKYDTFTHFTSDVYLELYDGKLRKDTIEFIDKLYPEDK